MASCLAAVLRVILCVVNTLYCILGVIVVILGIVFKFATNRFMVDETGYLNTTTIVLVVVGLIIFNVALSGCCGAIYKNKCLLITYSVVMLIFASGMIYPAVVTMKTDKIEEAVSDLLSPMLNSTIESLNMFEYQFQCCGLHGPRDYVDLPPSCCPDIIDSVQITNPSLDLDIYKCTEAKAYETGCITIITDVLVDALHTVGRSIISVIVIAYTLAAASLYLVYYITNRARPKIY